MREPSFPEPSFSIQQQYRRHQVSPPPGFNLGSQFLFTRASVISIWKDVSTPFLLHDGSKLDLRYREISETEYELCDRQLACTLWEGRDGKFQPLTPERIVLFEKEVALFGLLYLYDPFNYEYKGVKKSIPNHFVRTSCKPEDFSSALLNFCQQLVRLGYADPQMQLVDHTQTVWNV